MTLLEKAKACPVRRIRRAPGADPGLLEVAMAFAKCDVSIVQISTALGKKPNSTYARLASALMAAARRGEVVITYAKKS